MAYISVTSAKPRRTVPGRWAALSNSAAWSAHSFPKGLGAPAPQDVAGYRWSPDLQGCPCSADRCFLLQLRQWDVAEGLSGLRHCTGVLVMVTNYRKPCVVFGACASSSWEILIPFVQLSPGDPGSCKGLQSLKYFHISGLCLEENSLMLKASNQHGGGQFGPGSRRRFGLGNTSTSPGESPVLCPNCSAALVGAHLPPSGRGCRKGWHKTGSQT